MLTPELSSSPGCAPINRAFGMSLADVMEKIENDQTLEPTPKKKMLSAIRTACRVFRANPKFVPAGPGTSAGVSKISAMPRRDWVKEAGIMSVASP